MQTTSSLDTEGVPFISVETITETQWGHVAAQCLQHSDVHILERGEGTALELRDQGKVNQWVNWEATAHPAQRSPPSHSLTFIYSVTSSVNFSFDGHLFHVCSLVRTEVDEGVISQFQFI